MFEDMAVVLPQYESWFKICQQHRVSGQEERLAQSLALIYSDLIEFCVHIYFMFSKQNEGTQPPQLFGPF